MSHSSLCTNVATDGIISGNRTRNTCIPLFRKTHWELHLGPGESLEEIDIYMEHDINQPNTLNEKMIVVTLIGPKNELIGMKTLVTFYSNYHWRTDIPQGNVTHLRIENLELFPQCLSEVELYSLNPASKPLIQRHERVEMVVSFYHEPNKERNKELTMAITRNVQNPYISQIYVLIQDCNQIILGHSKVKAVCFDQQPLYKNFFEVAQQGSPDRVVIVSNGDVVYKDAVKHLAKVLYNETSTFFILPRWGYGHYVDENKCMSHHKSYDGYAFFSGITFVGLDRLDFPMNRKGAEHVACGHLLQGGLNFQNPCLDVFGLHLHGTEFRPYLNKNNFDSARIVFHISPPSTLGLHQNLVFPPVWLEK